MKYWIAKIAWGLLIFIFLLCIGLACCLPFLTYTELIQFILDRLQRPDLKNKLVNTFFTYRKFELIQTFSWIAALIASGMMVVCIAYRKKIQAFIVAQLKCIQNLLQRSIDSLKNLSPNQKVAVLITLSLITIRSVYYVLHFYAQYDECWNYNYFLSNSILSSLAAYNNYPLHNIISYIFIKLLPDSTFVMRLPSILFGLLNALIVFLMILRSGKGFYIALFTLGCFAVIPIHVFYFMYARGIMLALFFALLLFYFVIEKKIHQEHTFIIALCIALGCYSMLSFPIYILALFASYFLMQKRKTQWQQLIKILAISFGLGLIFFAPVLLGSGFGLGLQSNYTKAGLQIQSIFDEAQFNAYIFIGFYYGTYICIAINILCLIFGFEKKYVLFNLSLLSITFILPLINNTFLPARALSFQSLAFLFTFLLLAQKLASFKKPLLLPFALIVLIGFSFIAHQHTYFNWSSLKDKEVYTIAQRLKENNITSYYNTQNDFSYYVPGISYYHKIVGQHITYQTSISSSTRYTDEQNMLKANAIVVPRNKKVPGFKKVLFSNTSFTILYR